MLGAFPGLLLAIAAMSLALPADTRHIHGIEVDGGQELSPWSATRGIEQIDDSLVEMPRVEQRFFQRSPRISYRAKRSASSDESTTERKHGRGAERRGGGSGRRGGHTRHRFRGGKHARGGIFYRYEDIP